MSGHAGQNRTYLDRLPDFVSGVCSERERPRRQRSSWGGQTCAAWAAPRHLDLVESLRAQGPSQMAMNAWHKHSLMGVPSKMHYSNTCHSQRLRLSHGRHSDLVLQDDAASVPGFVIEPSALLRSCTCIWMWSPIFCSGWALRWLHNSIHIMNTSISSALHISDHNGKSLLIVCHQAFSPHGY